MNARSYKTVFSKRLGALVAVGEHATSQGKANGASGPGASAAGEGAVSALAGIGYVAALSASFAFVSLAWAAPATNALPTGGTVVQGAASMSQSANQLNITQSTQRAAINWQSFNIGAAATVNVAQPNAQAVLLNRVVGQSPSQIFGKLQANGHVILVNPNGVLFGKDGSVNAGGFTASTLNITDANFMAGNMVYERNGSTAGIVNQGSITTAPGGYVALLGATVSNEGSIHTQGGSVVMGAGETIKVPVSGTGRIKLELTPAAINASVSNSGSIVTEGGQVYMQALALNRAAAQILQSGSIDTTGEKGGDVYVLADGGHIRVDGSIKANSTNGTAGGDIYIGRDKDTTVLAEVGDASGAQLESQGGFVETSGQFLKVDGVRVIAKDWLLDPSDITISSAPNSNVTSTSPTDITPNGGAGTSSIVNAGTIQDAINSGTNVTIKTANASNTTGAGNITIANALVFKNTGATDATLSLIADNGITQNTGATITTDLVNSTKLVHISMEAKGNYQGNTAESTNSKGIALNSTITTNGTVTLTGTSKDTSGVQTGPTYSWGVTNNSRSGVVFNNGSGITADNFQVTGTHSVAAGNSFGVNGVYMNGTVTFKATGNTDSNITGNSNAQGNFGAGVMVMDGAKVTLENQGEGVTTLKGSNTHTGGGNGVRIGATNNNSVINAIGRVTLGQQAANTNAPIFIRSTIIASPNNAGKSGLRIVGQTEKNTSAVQIWDTNINAAGIDVVVDGVTANAAGVYIQTSPNNTWTTKNLTVTGVAKTTSGSSGSGVVVQRYPGVLTVNAGGNIDIQGTVEGGGNGSGLSFSQSGWGPQSPSLRAAGNITLRGNNRASTSNTSNALSIVSGVQVSADGNIVLQAETNNAAAAAINVASSGSFSSWSAAANIGAAQTGNMSLKSTSGDVLIQSNQGSIVLNNQLTSTLVNGMQTTSTDISGRNITVDNTGAGMAIGAGNAVTGTGGTQGAAISNGGNIDATGKITVLGTGKASNVGVLIADKRAITARGNLNIAGASTGGVGINTNGVLTANDDVNLTGMSSSTNVNAHGVMLTGKVNSTGGAVNITGSSTSTTGGAGAIIQATVDAKNNITLDGRSGNIKDVQGLVIQEAVTSAHGNITVTGETKAGDPGQRAVAITANGTNNGSLKVKDGQVINMNANTLFIKDTSFVNAGTGTVNIQTLTSGNEILIGGVIANDVMSSTLSSQKLGIDNTELNRIAAGNLVIGDTASSGKITVATATTTAETTGNITLQTKGDIAVNAALTVGTASGNKKLALHAGGNVTQASNAAIKAAELQLKGLANFTLVEKTNSVGKLAASGNKVVFTNAGALEIGDVIVSGTALSGVTTVAGTAITTETGDITINKAVTNSISGDVVLGAGIVKDAGDGTGGDVKTTSGIAVVNNNASGKTLIFTGSAATTGLLSQLDGSFSELRLSGDMGTPGTLLAQNADSNVKYVAGTNIASGAKAQVIFREKIALNTSTIAAATLNKTYGGANTKNNPTDQTALFAEMQAQLNQANPGQIITRALDTSNGAGEFKISKAALINDLSGSLNTNNASFSTSQHLTATVHEYGALISTKYAATLDASKAKVEVAKKALTGSIAQGSSTYGDALAPGNVNWSGNVVGDLVAPSAVNINTTGNISQGGYLNAGTYLGVQTVIADGKDAANYSFANVKGDYRVDQRPLTIAPGSVATKTADGTTAATVTPGALSNLVGTETLAVAATGTFSDANAGNNKAVNAFYTLQNGANGGLASNYILALGKPGNPDTRMTGTILAAVNPVTPIVPVNNNTGSFSRVRTVSGFGGAGAATGVLDDKAVTESREVCSDVFPENCECQPSVIPSIEICFAPKSVAATKEEK